MTNLLQETKETISENNQGTENIVFIGSTVSGYSCTWEEYELLADHDYDSFSDAAEVASDLTIIFKDGSYMTRGEYGGSEWWEFHTTPKLPENQKKIYKLVGGLWSNLSDMDEVKEQYVIRN